MVLRSLLAIFYRGYTSLCSTGAQRSIWFEFSHLFMAPLVVTRGYHLDLRETRLKKWSDQQRKNEQCLNEMTRAQICERVVRVLSFRWHCEAMSWSQAVSLLYYITLHLEVEGVNLDKRKLHWFIRCRKIHLAKASYRNSEERRALKPILTIVRNESDFHSMLMERYLFYSWENTIQYELCLQNLKYWCNNRNCYTILTVSMMESL